jgi:hypothetical protein
MKQVITLGFFLFLGISSVKAESDYLESVKSLGYISGEGLACNVATYPAYEHLARAYLVSSARSDEEQGQGMYQYNQAKVRAYLRERRESRANCAEVTYRFNNQKILKAKLKKNGTLIMPDGKVITPRQKYDATLLYDKTEDEAGRLDAQYQKLLQRQKKQAQKEGVFQKIQAAEAKRAR